EQFHGALIQLVQDFVATREMEGKAGAALQPDPDIFQDGELGKYGRNMERTDDAPAGNVRRRFLGDFFTVEEDAAFRGGQEFGQQVEAGRLACAVWSNEGM